MLSHITSMGCGCHRAYLTSDCKGVLWVETGCASGWKLAVHQGGNWLCTRVETGCASGWKLAVHQGGNWLCQWVETASPVTIFLHPDVTCRTSAGFHCCGCLDWPYPSLSPQCTPLPQCDNHKFHTPEPVKQWLVVQMAHRTTWTS